MSRNKHQDVRIRVLDQCFRNRSRQYTINDLVDACNDAIGDIYGGGISIRTIRDDIKFMRDSQGYNAPIVTKEWDGKKCIYFYSDPHFSVFKTELNQGEIDKLKATIQILSRFRGLPQFEWMEGLLTGLEDKFATRGNDNCVISFEQNIDYTAVGYLSELFDAIINRQVLKIHYRTFKGVDHHWTLHPYFIKQYNSRWFLFGRDDDNQCSILNVPLDRIVDCTTTKITYIKNDLVDFEEYFDDIIGVSMYPNQNECKVLLKFDAERFPYIISKPIHGSMKTVDKENCIIELNLKPNKELEALIFSYGNQVEVLEPQWLREQIKEKIEDLMTKYSSVRINCTDEK